MNLSRIAELLTRTAVVLRDVNSIAKSVEESSLAPLARRIGNKVVGKLVHKGTRNFYFRGGKKK